EHVLHARFDFEALEPITPRELAAIVPKGVFRERVLSACIVMAMIDAEASPQEGELLAQYGDALELHDRALATAQRVTHRQLLAARIDIARPSSLGQRGRVYFAEHGLRGFGRTLRTLLGIANPKLAARYRALADLPRGLLGREYYEFIRAN